MLVVGEDLRKVVAPLMDPDVLENALLTYWREAYQVNYSILSPDEFEPVRVLMAAAAKTQRQFIRQYQQDLPGLNTCLLCKLEDESITAYIDLAPTEHATMVTDTLAAIH